MTKDYFAKIEEEFEKLVKKRDLDIIPEDEEAIMRFYRSKFKELIKEIIPEEKDIKSQETITGAAKNMGWNDCIKSIKDKNK